MYANFASTAIKITKATATQNSASKHESIAISALEHSVDGAGDRRLGRASRRSGATIAVAASTAMSRTLVMAAAFVAAICLLGLGELRVELALQRLAALVRLGVEPLARFAGDRCARARASASAFS